MKKITMALFFIFVFIGGANASDTATAYMTVTYTEVAPACTFMPDYSTSTVLMGTWSLQDFTSVGYTTEPVSFHLALRCNQDFPDGIEIKFSGATDSNDPTVLALSNANSSGVAQGIGVVIYDDENNVVPLDSDSKAYTAASGNNDLLFKAAYKSVSSTVTAGVANATATFVIDYP